MLLIALVLFRQNFFQPLGLLFCDRLIYPVWVVADEELLTATVTPERSHLVEACCFLAASLFYRHCLHVLILDELAIVRYCMDPFVPLRTYFTRGLGYHAQYIAADRAKAKEATAK